MLQVVPVLTEARISGNTLTLTGGGLVEGASTFTVADASVADTAVNDGPDIYSSGRAAYLTIPQITGARTVNVTTAAGKSASITF